MHKHKVRQHSDKQLASSPQNSLCAHSCAHTHAHKHTGQLFLTSMTPWWMEVYCFFLSITRVMTITVAMTTPPTIRPIMAPLLEPTSSAKKTCRWGGKKGGQGEVNEGDQVTRTQPIRPTCVFTHLALMNLLRDLRAAVRTKCPVLSQTRIDIFLQHFFPPDCFCSVCCT